MVVLGVDPGFSVTGFACVQQQQGVRIVDCGYLKMSPKDSLPTRVGQFYALFEQKIADHKVTHISLETSFLSKNPQTFLKLGFLRGVLYLLADQHHLTIAEFAPREVKLAVTGFGGASKDQVATMMMRVFPKLAEHGAVEREDMTDALAVALCGVWSNQTELQKLQARARG